MMGNKIRGAKVTQPLNLLQGGHNACKAVRRMTASIPIERIYPGYREQKLTLPLMYREQNV